MTTRKSPFKPTPSISVRCPNIPEGVSAWEEQEINRHWRNALQALHRAGTQTLSVYEHLLGDPELDSSHLRQTVTEVAEARVALASLAGVINGIIHRQALAKIELDSHSKNP
jgi:hypothetical protein